MFKSMTVGKKIVFGFLIVLVLLGTVACVSVFGIGGIVANASEVISGNKLRGEIVQREVDHLNWANKLAALIFDDDITELDIQTDPTLCAFGQWYHSDGRKQAEALVPALATILANVEEPHRMLHESAASIEGVFKQPHPGLALSLARRYQEHLAWYAKVGEKLAAESAGLYHYQNLVRNAVDQAVSVVKGCDEDPSLGTEEDQKRHAMAMLKAMRFGPEGSDYVWINDTSPRMIMHPFQPELEGQDISQKLDPNGKPFFVEMVDTCHKSGGAGFVTYYWPLPSSETVAPKVSFVRLYKPWNWIVGSGVYLDAENPALVARADQFAAGEAFSLGVEADPTKCAFGKFLADKEVRVLCEDSPQICQALSACEDPHEQLHAYAIEIEKLVTDVRTDQALKLFNGQVTETLAQLKHQFESAIAAEGDLEEGMNAAKSIYAAQTQPSLARVQELLEEVTDTVEANVMTDEAMLAAASRTRAATVIISLIAGAVGIALALLVARGIINALKHVIIGLTQGSNQVDAAAGQVSQSSQSLAEGASEQASSLEETSASLEEMASMTRQNADHAQQANALMTEARDTVERGSKAMSEMSGAIEQIKNSSDETAKIIKTIDEIAFQTNLLALNAAVEAARAGEAGKGFAVVAEEVRNLAQRSAEAAKDTSELIEQAQRNADNGVQVTTEMANTLAAIQESAGKVAGLIGEIAAASGEQSQGIDQINTAVAQMDQITQSNAANSEQAASASEELSAQARELNDMVSVLAAMVGGQRALKSAAQAPARKAPKKAPEKKTQMPALKFRTEADGAKSTFPAVGISDEQRVVVPEQVIPLEEEDMADF